MGPGLGDALASSLWIATGKMSDLFSAENATHFLFLSEEYPRLRKSRVEPAVLTGTIVE
jgi:hypothetical protein